MYCIYNYIIINKQTTLIIITILLFINVTLNCWSHAYRTPLRYKRGGGELLKIDPKVPPVRNKCLATCNDIKETHVHIPSGIKYFTRTVLHYCCPKLRYCTEHETKQDWSLTTLRSVALESAPSVWFTFQR